MSEYGTPSIGPTSTQYSGGPQSNGTPSIEVLKHAVEIGGIDISGPFELPKPGLLISKRHVNGNAACFLLDRGCMGNVISLGLCQKLGITSKPREGCDSIMANETVQKICETTEPVAINLAIKDLSSPNRWLVGNREP